MRVRPPASSPGAGFIRIEGARPALPVLLSVPHAGRDYPDDLLAAARLPRARIETIEDRHADRLVAAALDIGATAIIATRARAWLDLNRDEREYDPGMIEPPPSARAATLRSARVDGGLGLIPRRIGGAEIWRARIPSDELTRRIALFHRPYHVALAAELARMQAEHGAAVLIDCHSMPPLGGGSAAARLVIGDRHGRTADAELVAQVRATAVAHGVRTALNAPYAGGYTLDRHGAPARHIHALQLEFDRSLYLDAALREPGAGLNPTARLLAAIAMALGETALAGQTPLAAE